MHKLYALSLIVIAALCVSATALADDPPKKDAEQEVAVGAESPKALVARVGKALKEKDAKTLTACIAGSRPEIRKTMVGVLMAAERFHVLTTKAKKKFGAEAIQKLGQSGGFLSFMRIDYAMLGAKGEVTEEGDKAKIKLTTKEGEMTSSRSVNAIKIDGKWVLDPGAGEAKDPKRAERDKKMIAMFKAMVPAMTKMMDVAEPAVESCADAAAFEAKTAPAIEACDAAVKAAQKKAMGGGGEK